MLTASDILKYGIVCTPWDTYASIDDLFSESENDPCIFADENAQQMGIEYYDINIAICQDGKCIVQALVFRNKSGLDKYRDDGVLIFNHKEI